MTVNMNPSALNVEIGIELNGFILIVFHPTYI
jgi:hypothetical protein